MPCPTFVTSYGCPSYVCPELSFSLSNACPVLRLSCPTFLSLMFVLNYICTVQRLSCPTFVLYYVCHILLLSVLRLSKTTFILSNICPSLRLSYPMFFLFYVFPELQLSNICSFLQQMLLMSSKCFLYQMLAKELITNLKLDFFKGTVHLFG